MVNMPGLDVRHLLAAIVGGGGQTRGVRRTGEHVESEASGVALESGCEYVSIHADNRDGNSDIISETLWRYFGAWHADSSYWNEEQQCC